MNMSSSAQRRSGKRTNNQILRQCYLVRTMCHQLIPRDDDVPSVAVAVFPVMYVRTYVLQANVCPNFLFENDSNQEARGSFTCTIAGKRSTQNRRILKTLRAYNIVFA